MDRLRCIEIFLEVAKECSFSSAARRLRLSRASVTKSVAQLETVMGAQLFARTTKTVNLTEAGRVLLKQGQLLLHQFNAVEEAVRQSVNTTAGTLHIGSPPPFAEMHLMALLYGFRRLHPNIGVRLHLDYGNEDLIAEGLDLTIRVAPSLRDTSLVAQRIASIGQVLVASPDYLRTRGTPATPFDLVEHDCLVHLQKSPNSVWTFDGPDGQESVHVRGPIRANFGEVLQQAALSHQGISMHPIYMVQNDIKQGRLAVVLPDFKPSRLDIYVLYPSRRNMPIRVRAFIDYLKQSAELFSDNSTTSSLDDIVNVP